MQQLYHGRWAGATAQCKAGKGLGMVDSKFALNLIQLILAMCHSVSLPSYKTTSKLAVNIFASNCRTRKSLRSADALIKGKVESKDNEFLLAETDEMLTLTSKGKTPWWPHWMSARLQYKQPVTAHVLHCYALQFWPQHAIQNKALVTLYCRWSGGKSTWVSKLLLEC